jgi:hypothetical protein
MDARRYVRRKFDANMRTRGHAGRQCADLSRRLRSASNEPAHQTGALKAATLRRFCVELSPPTKRTGFKKYGCHEPIDWNDNAEIA